MARRHRPEVVIPDICLEGSMDGFELFQELRMDQATRCAYVMMFTARHWSEFPARHDRLGIDALVSKPFRFADVWRADQLVAGRSRFLTENAVTSFTWARSPPRSISRLWT